MRTSMTEVDLQDGGAATDPAPDRPSVLRRYRWWALGLVVALVATAVVVQQRGDARAADRLAVLAQVPGVLAPLDAHVAARWTLPADQASVVYGRPVAGVLLGGSSGADGFHLQGVDAASGRLLWRTPVDVPNDETLWSWCRPVTSSSGTPLAVCTAGPDAPAALIALSSRTVWTVDPTTGTVLTSRRVRGNSTILVTDDQLLMTSGTVDGDWDVTSVDPSDGGARWSYRLPRGQRGTGQVQPQLLDAGSGRVLASMAGQASVLDRSGRALTTLSTDPGTWWVALRSGAQIGRGSSAGTGPRSVLLLPDLTTVAVSEQPVAVTIDDGSAPDVLLTRSEDGSALVARSVTTGGALWRAALEVRSTIVVQGSVYVGTSTGIVALDAGTGAVRWTRDLDRPVETLSTDGDDLVTVVPPTSLAAYSRLDGAPAWDVDLSTADLPTQVASVALSAGVPHPLVWGTDGSVVVVGRATAGTG